LALLHYTFVTCFQVPYNALGYELSSSYHGRTKVFAYRAFFAAIAKFILPWMFWLTLRPMFGGDAMVGVKWVAGIGGVIVILFIIPTIFRVKEGSVDLAKKQEKIDLLKAIRLTFKNAPFRILVWGITLTFDSVAKPPVFRTRLRRLISHFQL
jgi:GPH family glycoside/pentoside/hexuronide:cation symporter